MTAVGEGKKVTYQQLLDAKENMFMPLPASELKTLYFPKNLWEKATRGEKAMMMMQGDVYNFDIMLSQNDVLDNEYRYS